MTTIEVVEDLRLRGKSAYSGIIGQSQFSNTLSRIEKELSKRKTIREFFGKLGYTGDHDNWCKIANKIST